MASGLRQLTERERAIVNKYSTQHGSVFGLDQPIADDAGNTSSPLIRLTTLARLERAGAISRREALAGERFHALFRHAALDPLKAADLSRSRTGSSAVSGTPPSHERCRARIRDTLAALGGNGSIAASCLWHVIGCEETVAAWAIQVGVHGHEARGILRAALAVLAEITRSGRLAHR